MLPFAGSIRTSRRQWRKARSVSTRTMPPKKLKRPQPANIPAFEAGMLVKDVTPEHVETFRNLNHIFANHEKNISLRADGFLPVSRLLQHPLMANTSFKCLDDIVRWDKQRRFELLYRPLVLSPPSEDWWIRIRRGHNQNKDIALNRVTSADSVSLAIHCTTPELWKSIERLGIPRGDAPYLHFYTSIPGRESIFGKKPTFAKDGLSLQTLRPLPEILRPHTAKIIISIDAAKAMAAGIPFYTSKRNTIATQGNAYGVLEPQFFRRVDLIDIRMERVLNQVQWVDPHPKPKSKSKRKPKPKPKRRPTNAETVVAEETIYNARG